MKFSITCPLLFILVLELSVKQVVNALLSTSRFSLPRSSGDDESCRCNLTEIFTQLPYLIQAIGSDERTKFTFKGDKGERGADGPFGAQGMQGFPGRSGERGEPGRDGLPGRGAVGPKGEPGNLGRMGDMGRKGQKGEAAPYVYQRRTIDGNVLEIKGEKGESGRRGRKGDSGERGQDGTAGLPGVSVQGEKGAKGEPLEMPDLEELRGPIGPRGPPGIPGRRSVCRGCQFSNKLGKEEQGPIFIPMQGPPGPQGMPGLSVVGQKGEPGEPGPTQAATQTQESARSVIEVSSEDHLKRSYSHQVGTLAFVTSDESLFLNTRRGWRQVELGRFLSASTDRRRQYDAQSHTRDWNRSQ